MTRLAGRPPHPTSYHEVRPLPLPGCGHEVCVKRARRIVDLEAGIKQAVVDLRQSGRAFRSKLVGHAVNRLCNLLPEWEPPPLPPKLPAGQKGERRG